MRNIHIRSSVKPTVSSSSQKEGVQAASNKEVASLNSTEEENTTGSQEPNNSVNTKRAESTNSTNNTQQSGKAGNPSQSWTKEGLTQAIRKAGTSQGHEMLYSYLKGDIPVYSNVILSTFFDENGGQYSIKSDLTVGGKKIETLNDIAELYTYYNELYNANYNATPPKGMDIQLDSQTHMPVVNATENDIKNCGYNFLPEEIDAYFDKNADGTYSLKQGAVSLMQGQTVAFLSFDDFVKYLKGEDVVTMGVKYWSPDPSVNYQGHWSYSTNYPFISTNQENKDWARRHPVEGAMTEYHIKSYQSELNRLYPNSGVDIMSTYFYQSEDGEYYANTAAIKKDFPDYTVEEFLNMLPLTDALENGKKASEVFPGAKDYNPETEEVKTEYVVRSLEEARQKMNDIIADNPDKYIPTFLPNVYWVVDENDPSGGYFYEFTYVTSSGSSVWLTGVAIGGGSATWGDETYTSPEEDGASIPAKFAAAWLGGYDIVAEKRNSNTFKNDNIFYKDGKYYKYAGIEYITVYTDRTVEGNQKVQNYYESVTERILNGMVELSDEELEELGLK